MRYTLSSSRRVSKVRKSHMCSWCAELIGVGEPAVYRSYVFEGRLQHDHMHPECARAMNESDSRYLEDGWTPRDNERGVAAL